MPSEVQNGKAVIHGIRSSASALGITGSDSTVSGYASFLWDTAKAAHKWETEFIKDEKSFDASAVAVNMNIELDVVFTPAGSTRADAAGKTLFAVPLCKVTLSAFE